MWYSVVSNRYMSTRDNFTNSLYSYRGGSGVLHHFPTRFTTDVSIEKVEEIELGRYCGIEVGSYDLSGLPIATLSPSSAKQCSLNLVGVPVLERSYEIPTSMVSTSPSEYFADLSAIIDAYDELPVVRPAVYAVIRTGRVCSRDSWMRFGCVVVVIIFSTVAWVFIFGTS